VAGSSTGDASLHIRLDTPLPETLGVGAGTALFVAGTCFSARAPIAALALVVDGDAQPVMAHGMPRLDLMRALHPGLDPFSAAGMAVDPESTEDPLLTSYRSGFWGFARVGPRAPGERVRIELRATLRDGGELTTALGEVRVAAPPAPVATPEPAPGGAPLVAICMATHEPPADLFRRQVASIRGQTHRNWICVVSDDCSSPEAVAAMEAELADDPRFVLSRSPRRLGFYHNFERALALAPPEARFVALADQDDEWHGGKLETLLGALGGARLAYSDARIVTEDGEVVAETYWSRRRNNHEDLLSLLVANAVTGAASLLRREVLELALPFPPAQFAHFHDHWIALCALALGDIRFVDRPLYDYVQHGGATLGHEAANRMPGLRERAGALRRAPRDRVRLWRMHYFVDACRLTQFALVLRARGGEAIPRSKRRVLDAFLRADRSVLPLAGLAARGAREVLGRGRPETLGAEWMLAHAFAWRRLLGATVRDRPVRGLRLDAVPPPTLDPRPGAHTPDEPELRVIAEKVAPLRLAVRDDAPRRINLLIPTIDLEHFFGGYIAKLNLARRLAARGLRVRIVTVDPVGPLPRSWPSDLEAYSGLAGLFDSVEVAFGRESQGLEVSRGDAFVATTWWTAHVARQALEALDRERFLYLIQEYEPFTFPMGSYAALAAESYTLPHAALFSTELLRDYFRRHRIGVYAAGPDAGDRASAAFQNAITAIEPPTADELAGRATRRLLFYARPEPHAARNMFELGVLALARAVQQGAFGRGWTLHGVGTVAARRRLSLGGGASLELMPRSSQGSYAELLRRHDVGLALMYTPHPSLVPLEMASAGMLTVTNSFANKTPEALAAISANLIAAAPGIDAVTDALCAAAGAVEDVERRARGSRVDWSRDWDTSFPDSLLDRVETLLEAP
jgi:glycosyltransferase involved in cell wall biosynthesis